jgi:hypothetical protein
MSVLIDEQNIDIENSLIYSSQLANHKDRHAGTRYISHTSTMTVSHFIKYLTPSKCFLRNARNSRSGFESWSCGSLTPNALKIEYDLNSAEVTIMVYTHKYRDVPTVLGTMTFLGCRWSHLDILTSSRLHPHEF